MRQDDLQEIRQQLGNPPPPLILYNKSHSGSRMLARTLREQGIHLGSRLNESEDALPLVPLVEHIVEHHYPSFESLWHPDSKHLDEIAQLTVAAFREHLASFDPREGRPWGWKLGESLYALPYFAQLFPGARVVHLLRDGRDVAWCDHVAPEKPFWKKVYFDTDGLDRWRGLWMTHRAYERRPHLYNALHWSNSVRTGRALGSMLGSRYHEVRYEDLCQDFVATMTRLADVTEITLDSATLRRQEGEVRRGSIGKFRRHPSRDQAAVLALIEPTLMATGYLPPHPPASGTLPDRLRRWLLGA